MCETAFAVVEVLNFFLARGASQSGVQPLAGSRKASEQRAMPDAAAVGKNIIWRAHPAWLGGIRLTLTEGKVCLSVFCLA